MLRHLRCAGVDRAKDVSWAGTVAFCAWCLILAAGLVFSSTGTLAVEKKMGLMDPQAIDAFKRMSQHLKGANTLSFTTTGLREITEDSGIKRLRGRIGIIVLQRPDRFYARTLRDDGLETQAWFDGESLSIATSGANEARYAAITVPAGSRTIDGVLDHLIDEYDYVLQLGDLMYSDVYATLGGALLSAVHHGRKFVGGRLCHHLSLEFAGADTQLWVQDGDDPVPCRWAFTLRDEPSEPLFISTFDSWVSNPTIDPARFRFEPPGGATKMEMQDLLNQASKR